MDKVVISIIIPSYNSGKYLVEAIGSVTSQQHRNYEIIIVDDGSTDPETLELYNKLTVDSCRVLKQQNAGPAAARNAGVKVAQGEYLLFLDSDNKIRPGYIEKGIGILSNNPDIGVVYGKPHFFGSTTKPRFRAHKFHMNSILLGNYVDMCAVVRKKAWEDAEGFDENRVLIGHEDWEFWIRVGLKGWKFEFVDEVLFDYRTRENSLILNAQEDTRVQEMLEYVTRKHSIVLFNHYEKIYRRYMLYQNRPFKYFLRRMYSKYILKEPTNFQD
jgi:glycosyltransferase involved in cell wall biosynthesis